MGKLILLLVGAFGMASLFVTMGTQQNLTSSSQRLADDEFEILARNAALAGEEMGLQLLTEDYEALSFAGTHDGVPYTVTATPNGNKVVLQATSTATTPRGEEVPYTVRAEYERVLSSTIAEVAPPFMQYSFISEQDLTLKGTVSSDVYVAEGYENNVLNADLHTNGTLTLDGVGSPSDRVRGHGTYVDNAVAGNASHWDKKFKPYYFNAEANGKSVYRTDEVDIEALAMVYSESDQSVLINGTVRIPITGVLTPSDGVGGTYYLSSASLGGTPSREHPAFYYVRGNLTFSSDMQLPGYTVFLVEGSVDAHNKKITVAPSTYTGGDESTVAIYAAGSIRVSGNGVLWAQLFSQSGGTFGHGKAVLYGSFATRGSATFTGTVDLKYRKASPAMTVVWDEGSVIKFKRLAYTEW